MKTYIIRTLTFMCNNPQIIADLITKINEKSWHQKYNIKIRQKRTDAAIKTKYITFISFSNSVKAGAH